MGAKRRKPNPIRDRQFLVWLTFTALLFLLFVWWIGRS